MTRFGVMGVNGICITCGEDFSGDNSTEVLKEAKAHAQKNKHNVKVEVTTAYHYRYEEAERG